MKINVKRPGIKFWVITINIAPFFALAGVVTLMWLIVGEDTNSTDESPLADILAGGLVLFVTLPIVGLLFLGAIVTDIFMYLRHKIKKQLIDLVPEQKPPRRRI